MSFTIRCECGQTLKVPDAAAGRDGQCPSCGRRFTIPSTTAPPTPPPAPPGAAPGTPPPVPVASVVPGPAAAPPPPGSLRCWQCGEVNQPGTMVCARCGVSLAPPTAMPPPHTEDAALAGLIPYKNVPALVGYYLAVFALIPCVGVPLGIAAVVLGLVGIVRAQVHPEARGKVHAWFAVIFGTFCAVGHVILIIMLPKIMEMFD